MANNEFYKYARAYDIAFAGRDYNEECNFIEWCFSNHSTINIKNNDEKVFLELGCGPAGHAIEFAKRNWKTFALDLSPEMLLYAEEKAQKENVKIETICSDMVEYKTDAKADVIGLFTESITHILTNEDLLRHFKNVAKSLKPGGIYIIETGHPLYFFPDNEPNIWTMKEGDTEVTILFGKPDDEYDAVNQQWNVTTRLEIKENGKSEISESKSKHRWYLAQELKALIQLSGEFEDFWFYGNMDVPPGPLDNSQNSDSMNIVLRKRKGLRKK